MNQRRKGAGLACFLASLLVASCANQGPQDNRPVCQRPKPSPQEKGLDLAYASDRDGDFEIYWERDGNPVQLTDNNVPDRQPAWSPDGTRIAFVRRVKADTGITRDQLWILSIADCTERRLAANKIHSFRFPAWSPKGDRIAFSRVAAPMGDDEAIFAVAPDGTQETRLVASDQEGGGAVYDPTWAPDASKLAFISEQGALATASLCCSRERRVLISSPWSKSSPIWSPDGGSILFTGIHAECQPEAASTVDCRYRDDGDLFLYDLSSNRLSALDRGRADSVLGAWIDAEHFLVADDRSGSYDIYELGLNEEPARRLVGGPSDEIEPDVLAP